MKEIDSSSSRRRSVSKTTGGMFTKDQWINTKNGMNPSSILLGAQESIGWKVNWNPTGIYVTSLIEKNTS